MKCMAIQPYSCSDHLETPNKNMYNVPNKKRILQLSSGELAGSPKSVHLVRDAQEALEVTGFQRKPPFSLPLSSTHPTSNCPHISKTGTISPS